MTNLRTVVGSMELDEVLSQRDAINSRLLTRPSTRPPAVGREGRAHRDQGPDAAGRHHQRHGSPDEGRARTPRGDHRGRRREVRPPSPAPRAQKQSAILQAEGRREAAFRDAEAREREAEAEAKATEPWSPRRLRAGDVNAINYFVAQKYVEAFAKLAESPQQKTVIVPAEMSALVGTVGGIGELVKAISSDGPPPRPPQAQRGRGAVPPSGA